MCLLALSNFFEGCLYLNYLVDRRPQKVRYLKQIGLSKFLEQNLVVFLNSLRGRPPLPHRMQVGGWAGASVVPHRSGGVYCCFRVINQDRTLSFSCGLAGLQTRKKAPACLHVAWQGFKHTYTGLDYALFRVALRGFKQAQTGQDYALFRLALRSFKHA